MANRITACLCNYYLLHVHICFGVSQINNTIHNTPNGIIILRFNHTKTGRVKINSIGIKILNNCIVIVTVQIIESFVIY